MPGRAKQLKTNSNGREMMSKPVKIVIIIVLLVLAGIIAKIQYDRVYPPSLRNFTRAPAGATGGPMGMMMPGGPPPTKK
jgi:hypothetical protein